MSPRVCPACGGKPLLFYSKNGMVRVAACDGCGLPVALWPRWKAAMECADLVFDTAGDDSDEMKLARKALGKARRKAT